MRHPATVLRAGTLLLVTLAARAGAWEVDVDPSAGADDTGVAVAIDAAGNVVTGGLAGAADHFTVVKLASQDGAEIWRVDYAPGRADSIVLDTAQNVYAAGVIASLSNHFAVVKLDGVTGAQLWQAAEDTSIEVLGLDGAGNILGAGGSSTVLKLDPATGAEQWRATTDLAAVALAVDGAGNAVAAGTIAGEFAVVAFDGATGNELWRATVAGSAASASDQANGVAIDPDGSVVAAGQLENTGTGRDWLVLKLDGSSGTELWRAVVASPPDSFCPTCVPDDVASALALDPSGNPVVTGYTSFVVGQRGIATSSFTVLKLAGADGSELWRATVGEGGFGGVQRGHAVAVDPNGDVLAGGTIGTLDGCRGLSANPNLSPSCNFAVAKLGGATGTLVWEHVLRNALASGVNAIAVDPAGNVAATGFVGEGFEGTAFATVKLDGATGGGPVCRNGIVEAGEDCEPSNSQPCCSSTCAFAPSTTICNPRVLCTLDSYCTGTGLSCPAQLPAPDGTPCNDLDACTEHDACTSGVCRGSAVVCAAPDACHESATCDRVLGCLGPPKVNGTPCDDGDACTVDDRCVLGVCNGSPRLDCEVGAMKCYTASAGAVAPQPMTLAGALGTDDVTRTRVAAYCTPASVDGGAVDVAAAHLECFTTTTGHGTMRPIHVTNAYGDQTIAVGSAQTFCVPSDDGAAGRRATLDHFACYRASGRTVRRNVAVADPYETKAATVLTPAALCGAVAATGGPASDPRNTLVCYRIRETGLPRFTWRVANPSNEVTNAPVRVRRPRTVCVPSTITPCAQVVSTSTDPTTACGGPALTPPASAPFCGALYDDPVAGNRLADLGCGCTYEGGGDSEYYPAPGTATGARSTYDVPSCSSDALTLAGNAGAGTDDCTLGPTAKRVCTAHPSTTCSTDADCGGAGPCNPLPRCFSGLPLEVGGIASACVLNVVAAGGTGTLDRRTGVAAFGVPVLNYTYLMPAGAAPCPRCVSGRCTAGARSGLACTSPVPGGVTHDCPPDDSRFYAALDLRAPGGQAVAVGTGTAVATAADGVFCPGQRNPGAFGQEDAKRIVAVGSPAGNLADGAPHALVQAGVACIPPSGNPVADLLADLPGPNAASRPGVVQLVE